MGALDRLFCRPWVMALSTALWMMAAIMPTDDPLMWAAIATATLGVSLSIRFATAGAGLVLIASIACLYGGAPYGALELFLPTMWVLFWFGKQHSMWWVGVLATVGFAGTTAARTGSAWYAFPTAFARL